MRARVALLAGLGLLAAAVSARAVPFWGARQSLPADTDPAALGPGDFVWVGDAVTTGPIVVAVSLAEQRAYVYRNGVRIGVSTVSSGRAGHRTPTGVFTVLQKDADHHSSKYNDAAMPFTERLTWDGVALHAGGLPGYPSSHGCVHLPSAFAQDLFDISSKGMVVVIADEHSGPQQVTHPAAVAPVDATSGADVETPRLAPSEELRWTPEASPEGPVSMLVSAADLRVLVFRNGVEIGRARIELRDPGTPIGTHAFVMLDDRAPGPAAAPGAPLPRWIAIGVPGYAAEQGQALDPRQVDRATFPPEFRAKLHTVLGPGATLVVTDAPALEQTTGVPLTVVSSDPPPAPAS